MAVVWKKCSACKKDILTNEKYYQCSVSTCNGKRTGLAFCSVPCFERHLPGARHKDAAAIEETAPSAAAPTETTSATQGTRRIITQSSKAATGGSSTSVFKTSANQHEILVVASKLKKYIQDRAGMNTSQSVMNVLSDELRKLCDKAILNAEKDGRKTVMDRDFK